LNNSILSLFKNLLIFLITFTTTKDALPGTSSDTLRVYYLGEVVVTAQRSPTSLTSSLREVTSQTIRQRQIQNIAEAIGITSGGYVSIGRRNEMVVQLRGIEQRQIAVLLDGVPIYVPYDGLVDLGQIPVGAVSKITVTQGNASVLYGPNSLGGSINIVTLLPTQRHTRLQLMGGSGKLQSYSLNQSGSVKSFGYLLGLGYNRQDYFPLTDDFSKTENEDGGARNNSYYKKFDLFTKLTWRPHKDHHSALSFSYLDNEKGLPPAIYSDTKLDFWRFPEWRKWVLNLTSSHMLTPLIILKGTIFYDKYDNVLDAYRDDTYTKKKFHSTYDDYSTGANLFFTYSLSKVNKLTFGLDYKRDVHREQGNYGEPFDEYKMDSYTLGMESELKISNTTSLSSGISLNYLNPIYANGNPLREDIKTLDARIGIHHNLSESAGLFGTLGHKTRFPTLKELYSTQMKLRIPNPNLKEEESFNAEAGWSYKWQSNDEFNLTVFASEIRNAIVDKWVIVDSIPYNQWDNIGKAHHTGIEVSVIIQPIRNLALNGSYTFSRARNRSDDRTTDKLPYRPEHLVKLEQEYNLPFGLVFSLEENYVSKRAYLDQDNLPHNLDGYFLLDLQFRQFLWEHLTFSFSLYNILDEYYESEYGFPMPGRNFRAGMEFDF
jgi:iron complex outermembrane receptor protein